MRYRPHLLLLIILAVAVGIFIAIREPDRSAEVPVRTDAEVPVAPEIASQESATVALLTDEAPPAPVAETGGPVRDGQPGRIFGRVYDVEGMPAADVVVSAFSRDTENRDAREDLVAVTDTEGSFALASLSLGDYSVLARDDDDAARQTCQLRPDHPIGEVVLVLKPANSISGEVVGPSYDAVPKAMIHPVLHDGKTVRRNDSTGFATQAAADGRFHFLAPEPGAWQFLVRAPGYTASVSPPLITGTMNARIQLAKGFPITGRIVQDSDNMPIKDARVDLSMEQIEGPPLVAVSDKSGDFKFDSVAPGDYLLNVRADAHILPETPVTLTVAKVPIANLELRLVTGGVFRGFVIAEETGEPLSGIEVRARRTEPESTRRAPSISGAGGEFEVTGLSAGQYEVSARGPHRMSMENAPIVQLQAGQVVEGIALALTHGLVVSGRVLDTLGNPVAGADVRGRGGEWQTQEFSDADGAFLLAHIPAGQEVTVSASTTTATSGPQSPVVVPEDGLRNVDIVLATSRDALLAGIVVDGQNRPLMAQVTAWPDDGEPFEWPPLDNSDAEGRFVLPHVSPGDYRLHVTPIHGAQLEVLRIGVGSGQQIRNLRLVYPAEGALNIVGRVVDPDGAGVPCLLNLNGNGIAVPARSEIGGEFRFENIALGSYMIVVQESLGFQGAYVLNVDAGMEDVEIVLEPTRRLSGQVVDASGNPITEFEIALEGSGAIPSQRSISQREFQLVSHPEGLFLFEVADGNYEVLVRAEGYDAQQFSVGGVSAEEPANNLHFVLQ